jgi:hypothetical protein
MRSVISLLLLVLAAAAAELSPTEIVQRAADREAENQEFRRQYTFRETLRQRVAKKDTYEAHDIFYIAGKEYRKLIEKNGSPLSPEKAAEEQRRFDKELAKFQQESPEKAQKRLAKERKEQQEFRDQIAKAFDFRLVGEEDVSGKPCYRIHAEPRPGFKAKGDAKVLSKLKGDIWVDKTGFHWAKVDLESVEPISGLGGMVRLAKGTRIVTTRTFVNSEVWFPERVDVKATAKALLFISAGIDIQVQYSNFRKFSVDSKVVFSGE